MKTIAFTAIVRNEQDNILNCLESVKDLCDKFIILDTGSNDETINVVKDFFKKNNLDGDIISDPWVSFSTNRTNALNKAKDLGCDYVLMLDADETMNYKPDFNLSKFKENLKAQVYDVETNLDIIYYRPLLTRADLNCFYKSVIHEFLECPNNWDSRDKTEGVFVSSSLNGYRSKQSENKFINDIKVLKKELETETDEFLISRYTFYLAESLKNSGNSLEAVKYYRKRTQQGFWDQEIFESYYAMAKCFEDIDEKPEIVMSTYLQAFEACPSRAESLHDLAFYCRKKEWFNIALMYALQGTRIPLPDNGLFVKKWIYDYGLKDEASVSAYWTGDYETSYQLSVQLVKENLYPESQEDRIKANLQFAKEKIG